MAGVLGRIRRDRVIHARLNLHDKNANLSLKVRKARVRRKTPFGKHPHRFRPTRPLQVMRTGHRSKQPAPNLEQSFVGIVDTGWNPPDTMGAAGANHLVSVVNGGFAIFNKETGAKSVSITLQQFWSGLGTQKGQPAYYVYDPKILYDTFSSRFVIVSAAGLKSSSEPGSWLLLSVSGQNDPLAWRQWAIESDPNGPNWSDYPGIGLDENYIYLTANMFQGERFQNVKAWVVPKQQLINQAVTIQYFYFINPPGAYFTTQPTQVYGSPPNGQYLVTILNGLRLQLNKITFVNGRPVWNRFATVTVAPFSNPNVPDAKQKGTTQLIETNDTRLLNAVFRNGSLYTTHHVASTDGNRTEVAWYQIDPTRTTPVQQGRIRDASLSYYYPSIAVNANGDLAVGFSGSSSNQYASAYYTGRASSDTAGTMRDVALLKAGIAPYLTDRWGDFSATVVDPDGSSFWTIQEYVYRQNLWGTWWGKLRFANGASRRAQSKRGTGNNVRKRTLNRSRPWLNSKLRFRTPRRRR